MQDIVGNTYGRLTVLSRCEDYIEKNGTHRDQYICICSCSNHTLVKKTRHDLLNKRGAKSCGCLHREMLIKRNRSNIKHNHYDFDTYEYAVCFTESKDSYFIFDKEDYDKVKSIYWSDHKGYAYGSLNGRYIQMSRLIMNINSSEFDVDHINHDTRDNRKQNLRVVTHSQNMKNQKLRKDNTSGYTGIRIRKLKDGVIKYQTSIQCDNNTIYLGTFANLEDAVAARRDAVQKYFGDYGNIQD